MIKFNKTNKSISWANWSWNPVTGCRHGCKYCYARTMTKRFKKIFPNGFEPSFYPERLAAPFNTKAPSKSDGPAARNVFTVSMGDLFGEWVEQPWIDQVMDTVRQTQQWNYIFLTKNPQRLATIDWPENAWVGTTVDTQARVAAAEEAFESVNAKVKFVSCEPLLEEIKFSRLELFNWIIIGAQTRPTIQPDRLWVNSLITQACEVGCKIYCKPNLTACVKEFPE
jgi:protein gp37